MNQIHVAYNLSYVIHMHSTCILAMGQVSFSAIGSSFQNSLKQLLFWVCSMTNFFLVHCFLDHLLIQQNAKGNCHKNFLSLSRQYFYPLGTAAASTQISGRLVKYETENRSCGDHVTQQRFCLKQYQTNEYYVQSSILTIFEFLDL